MTNATSITSNKLEAGAKEELQDVPRSEESLKMDPESQDDTSVVQKICKVK